jgi:hypothetical protein
MNIEDNVYFDKLWNQFVTFKKENNGIYYINQYEKSNGYFSSEITSNTRFTISINEKDI